MFSTPSAFGTTTMHSGNARVTAFVCGESAPHMQDASVTKGISEPAAAPPAGPAALTHRPLHHRQFVIGPARIAPDGGWRTKPLPGSLVLSHSAALRVARVRDATGVMWHLLGRAVAAVPGAPSPEAELAARQSEPIEQIYTRWAGRWALVGDAEIHTDASGAMGCVYRPAEDGTLWVSSSPALINDLPGIPPAAVVGPALLVGSRGMDWYPPPASRFEGVHRLLPSQILRMSSGGPSIRPRPLLDDAFAGMDHDRLLDAIESILRTTLASYAAADEACWLPLTGGIDSRLVLAAAAAVGARFTTYTFAGSAAAHADLTLPPLLAAAVERPHVMIAPGHLRDARRTLYDLHTACHSVEVDRELFARSQWDSIPEDALSLRGGIFEIGRGFYADRLPERLPDEPADAEALIARRFQFDRFHRGSSAHRDGIRRWLAWIRETPQAGVDWRDRLYLEQTVAGWLSSTAQALDLVGCELAYPASSQVLLSALLAVDPRSRRRGDHHVELIGRLSPALLDYPINPPDPFLSRSAALLRREWHDLRTYPGRLHYVRHRAAWLAGQARARRRRRS